MPRQRRIYEPKTFNEAKNMVQKGWWWLIKKYPPVFGPLTLWMLFGGAIFLYNYTTANKFDIELAKPLDAKPIGQVYESGFSLMPSAFAYAPQDKTKGPEIRWKDVKGVERLWGYEDVRFEAKKVLGQPIILVHDKQTGETFTVKFYGDFDSKLQMKK